MYQFLGQYGMDMIYDHAENKGACFVHFHLVEKSFEFNGLWLAN